MKAELSTSVTETVAMTVPAVALSLTEVALRALSVGASLTPVTVTAYSEVGRLLLLLSVSDTVIWRVPAVGASLVLLNFTSRSASRKAVVVPEEAEVLLSTILVLVELPLAYETPEGSEPVLMESASPVPAPLVISIVALLIAAALAVSWTVSRESIAVALSPSVKASEMSAGKT